MKTKYKVILFDLDGTIADSGEGITRTAAYTLERFGIHRTPEELIPFIGPPLIQSFIEMYGFSQEDALRAVDIFRERYAETGRYENRVYDGILPLLTRLRAAGYRIGVATTKLESVAVDVVAQFGLTEYFDTVTGALDVVRNTKVQVIEEALARLGNPARETVLMIGDRLYDMIGAREAGVDAMGALYGYGSEKELTENGALYLVSSPAEIATFLLDP